MRSLKVRYLEARRIAGGRTAYYYNPKKDLRDAGIVDRQPLGEDLAAAVTKAEALNAIVDEYRADKKAGKELDRDRKKPGSISDLFDRYERSHFFTQRAPKTQTDYRKCLRTLEDTVLKNGRTFGDMPADRLEHVHADALYSLLKEKHGVAYANAMVRVARRVFSIGLRWKFVKQNPFSRPELQATQSRSVVWTNEQMRVFMNAARAEGYPSLALIMLLSYELAQRVVDARLLTWDVYDEGIFSFSQTKTVSGVVAPPFAF